MDPLHGDTRLVDPNRVGSVGLRAAQRQGSGRCGRDAAVSEVSGLAVGIEAPK